MVVMYQIIKAMQHMSMSVCVWMLRNECPWNNRHFMTWKVAHPWWGSNPWSLDYIPSSTDNCHVSDHQSNAYQIYVCISGALNQTRQIWGIWKLRPAYSSETPNLGQIGDVLSRVTLKFDGWPGKTIGHSLCCFKLSVTFHSHQWIQTGVTVRKRPIWVKLNNF